MAPATFALKRRRLGFTRTLLRSQPSAMPPMKAGPKMKAMKAAKKMKAMKAMKAMVAMKSISFLKATTAVKNMQAMMAMKDAKKIIFSKCPMEYVGKLGGKWSCIGWWIDMEENNTPQFWMKWELTSPPTHAWLA